MHVTPTIQAFWRMARERMMYNFRRLLGRPTTKHMVELCRRGFPRVGALWREMIVRRTYLRFCGRVYRVRFGCNSFGGAEESRALMHFPVETDRMHWLMGLWRMKEGEVWAAKGQASNKFVSCFKSDEKTRSLKSKRDSGIPATTASLTSRNCRAPRLTLGHCFLDWRSSQLLSIGSLAKLVIPK